MSNGICWLIYVMIRDQSQTDTKAINWEPNSQCASSTNTIQENSALKVMKTITMSLIAFGWFRWQSTAIKHIVQFSFKVLNITDSQSRVLHNTRPVFRIVIFDTLVVETEKCIVDVSCLGVVLSTRSPLNTFWTFQWSERVNNHSIYLTSKTSNN
jgi:hypothetical protein